MPENKPCKDIEIVRLSTPVEYEGKLYCWDYSAKQIVIVTFREVPIREVPEEVIIAMLDMAHNREDQNGQD